METCNAILGWAMRIGYGARGLVYLIIGVLAMFAAINGGEAEGSNGALVYLSEQPFGKVLLTLVAMGLFIYALWRFVDALLDLEDEGRDVQGIASRAGQFMSGAAHTVLGVSAMAIVLSAGGSGGGGNGAESSSAFLMNYPGGRWGVIIAGVVTGCVGAYLVIKSCRSGWKDSVQSTPVSEAMMPFVRFGLVAHGLVILIIAGLFVWAGVSLDSDKAGGLEEALMLLESQIYGRVILFITGAGLLCFSSYCFLYAGYKIVPKLAKRDIKPLFS